MCPEGVCCEGTETTCRRVMNKAKELVRAGNVRRISIRNRAGRTVLDVPLTVGVIGAVLAPELTAIGAIAALVAHGSIVVANVGSAPTAKEEN